MSKALIDSITRRVLNSQTGYTFTPPKRVGFLDGIYYPSPSAQPEFQFKYFQFDLQRRMSAMAYPIEGGFLVFSIDHEASQRSALALDRAIASGLIEDEPIDSQLALAL